MLILDYVVGKSALATDSLSKRFSECVPSDSSRNYEIRIESYIYGE